jgi:hypothetical protein
MRGPQAAAAQGAYLSAGNRDTSQHLSWPQVSQWPSAPIAPFLTYWKLSL